MNFYKLYELQRVLMERIGYDKEDRFDKTIIALLVEVGECANEWRGFKYWSKNQSPRTSQKPYMWKAFEPYENHEIRNPLLEEYVDGLHFLLQIGIELDVEYLRPHSMLVSDPLEVFKEVYRYVLILGINKEPCTFQLLLNHYLLLGCSLGFTSEEIETAYISKNEVNHERQTNGY